MIGDDDLEFKPINNFPQQWEVLLKDKIVARVTHRVITNIGYVTERMRDGEPIAEMKFDDRDGVTEQIIAWCNEDQKNTNG